MVTCLMLAACKSYSEQPETASSSKIKGQVTIQVSTAFLNEEEAKAVAFDWVFSKPGQSPVFFLGSRSETMAGILTPQQYEATVRPLAKRRFVFESSQGPTGVEQKIHIGDEGFLQITPAISGDGVLVHMHISAVLRSVPGDKQSQLQRADKMAILRDGQTIVLGDLPAPEAQNNSVTKHPVRLIFVRTFINDVNGKPLQVWEQRAHETRFYPGATPHTQSEIVAQVQPPFR
jgi:hypothetical protein